MLLLPLLLVAMLLLLKQSGFNPATKESSVLWS
jgi:hypothetical protein